MKTKPNYFRRIIGAFLLLSLLLSCSPDSQTDSKLFTLLPSGHTHIDFENRLTFRRDFNILNYRNFYDGGGVAIGDVNNDSLPDIYLTANMEPNRLYVNKGNFEFEDVTEEARVAGRGTWSTGVSMVDINADGWLDIYVCNTGPAGSAGQENELFINNGDGTFSERAEEYGLAGQSYSIHAAFFDYDKDGDLDVYILNNSPVPNIPSSDKIPPRQRKRTTRSRYGGDRLLRNDNGHFVDVSAEAGIYGSIIGYGLGVSVSDLDKDGWPDLYISNDFFERDYIYMNNGDGTFRETLTRQMGSISLASMGADIADITGDGYPEIFVTEMLRETNERLKTDNVFIDWDVYRNFYIAEGYHRQYARNMLHLNRSVVPGRGLVFSEVGRMAGVEATDWSWGALITDLDNDGFKDLFVANGIYHDILNQDYIKYISRPRPELLKRMGNRMVADMKKIIAGMPSTPLANYAFAGGPGIQFSNQTAEWDLDKPSFSNGAAYGDLDNDGDLDLVVNNVNMEAFVYRNNARKLHPDNHYLKVVLQGAGGNTLAVGAQVSLKAGGRLFYQEQMPNRGFQSSVDPRLNFGLGEIETIDTLLVNWSGGGQTLLTQVPTNQTLYLEASGAEEIVERTKHPDKKLLFEKITDEFKLDYRHWENPFNAFERNSLLFHMRSTEGPPIAVGDVNGDGREDFFVGGAKGSPGKLFIQRENGQFRSTNQALFEADRASEDIDCLFFDADGDGDPDLYVASGGSAFPVSSPALADRLYINNGKGKFIKSEQILPAGRPESTSVVKTSDYDRDGDLDLFVGVRFRPGLLGIPQNGYLLQNDGNGQFKNITETAASGLLQMGMITDAAWSDYDNDGDDDLIVAGKWMPVKVFENDGAGKFKDQTKESGLAKTRGWWNTIEAADIDGDGDDDFVAGNHGLNSKFKAGGERPVSWYINDFDRNGTIGHILCTYNGNQSYPLISRDDLVKQLPYLKAKYPTNESFKDQTIEDIFPPDRMRGAIVHQASMLESVVLLNSGDGTFSIHLLPWQAQLSPVYAILIHDMDGDGTNDLLLGGNLYAVKPRAGRYDAGYGVYLKGTGGGNFRAVKPRNSGLVLEGEVRDFALLDVSADNSRLLVTRNNDTMQVFEF